MILQGEQKQAVSNDLYFRNKETTTKMLNHFFVIERVFNFTHGSQTYCELVYVLRRQNIKTIVYKGADPYLALMKRSWSK